MSSRSNNNNVNVDDEELEKLIILEGEDAFSFENEHQRSERLAEERRRQRRQRLAQLAGSINDDDNLPNPPQKKIKLAETTSASDSSIRPTTNTHEDDMDDNSKDDNDDDGFDMFSDSVSPMETTDGRKVTAGSITKANVFNGGNHPQHQQHDADSWDDAEGYYKAAIGEVMEFEDMEMRFRVAGVIGKGVFSTVLKCTVVSNPSATPLPPVVALKLIRRNETMAKAALTELAMLQTLTGSPGIVELVVPPKHPPTEYRGHVVLVFGFYEYNLRDVLQKFGKSVGLSIAAVRSYFGQLLSALSHLKKHKIIHADLKPDNILVSQDFGTVRLGDFGSAMMAEDSLTSSSTGTMAGAGPQPAANPVPYLVSRFYRAPEIILGLVPDYTIDLWSLAVSMAELFLGDVVFRGRSNNDMLYVFMQHLGPISNRVIRQHLVACSKSAMTLMPHFVAKGTIYYFRQHTTDPVTGEIVYKELSLTTKTTNSNDAAINSSSTTIFPNATPLSQRILKSQSATDPKKLVRQFCQLLLQCLALDPTRRISLKQALQHEFFQSPSATSTQTTTSTPVAATK
jgi:serine/threonine-protein kinase PRP4